MTKTKAPVPARTTRPRPGALAPELKKRIEVELPGWAVVKRELVGSWRFADFANALGAAVRTGALAEQAGHHPDLRLGWGYLEVRLSTHDAGGITEKDVALAGRIHKALGKPQSPSS